MAGDDVISVDQVIPGADATPGDLVSSVHGVTPARHRRLLLVLVLGVIALSATARVVNLDAFRGYVFDEHYYVHDAVSAVHGRIGPTAAEPWKPGDSRSLAHPPLGVLSIAAGVLLFGDDPWGWRLPAAVAGVLLIALVYPLARRLGLARQWALAALLLAAADTMLLAEARVGVLDTFVALWSAATVYCALRCVQSHGHAARWLVLCGLAGGAAVASKWSGALALVAAMAIVAIDRRRRGRAGSTQGASEVEGERRDGPAGRAVSPLALVACLVALPLLVYLASYADYFASGHTIGQWLHLQGHMATFNLHVRGSSDMASPPASWIFDVSPIWYRWGLTQSGVRGLVAIGNPLLWWGAVAAFVALLWLAWRRRDGRLAVAPLLVAVLYLPWLAAGRQTYIYYLTPVVPFLAILVATALARLAGDASPSVWRSLAWFAAGTVWMALAAGGTLAVRLIATVAVLAFVVGAVLVERWRRGETATRPSLAAAAAWLYTGAVAGLAVAWLPFLLTLPASYGYYERLTWLPTWR